jgi:hypothetical protein
MCHERVRRRFSTAVEWSNFSVLVAALSVSVAGCETETHESGATTTEAINGDRSLFNFEDGTQGWTGTGPAFGSLQRGTSDPFAGQGDLVVNFSDASGLANVFVRSPGVPAGAAVTFHVQCSSFASIDWVQPYAQEGQAGNWQWTGTATSSSSLASGWNTLSLAIPANATPEQTLGVQFHTTGDASATPCAIDTVGWRGATAASRDAQAGDLTESGTSGGGSLTAAMDDAGSTPTAPTATTGDPGTAPPPQGTTGSGTSAPVTGLGVSVQGNKLVDAHGNTLQLRGVNFSGFESVAVQGWDPSDPSGAQGGQTGGPRWSAIAGWDANVVRIPLNEDSWLGLTCTDTGNSTRSADPGNNYQASVETQVQEANAAGIYVILDLHWAAPGSMCPMLQTQMPETDHSLTFWTSIANAFKDNPAVMFELYNEPYFDFGFNGDPWAALLNGGSFTSYPATGNSGVWQQINTSWNSVGMQQMLNAVRATGATNVVLTAGVSYNDDLSGWLTHMPSDPLNQLAASWHPYPPTQSVGTASVGSAGTGYAVGDTITLRQLYAVYQPAVLSVTAISAGGGVTGVNVTNGGDYLQTNLPTGGVAGASTSGKGSGASFMLSNYQNVASQWSMPSNWPAVLAIAAQVPVVLTETGEHDTTGTVGSPFLEQLLPWCDTNGLSYLGWTWDVWQDPDDVLITDVGGDPTDGYGQYFQQHLRCVGSGQTDCP